MRPVSVSYRVRMDKKIFRAFALYDTFRLKKHARLPLVFLTIMAVFAFVALFSGKPQRGLIAGVLLALGLGMPALYAGTFLYQVNKKAGEFNLEKPRPAYTVTLLTDEILVHNDLKEEEDVHLLWEKLYRVIRRKNGFYFYAVPQKAFILPDKDADCTPAEAIRFIEDRLKVQKSKLGEDAPSNK